MFKAFAVLIVFTSWDLVMRQVAIGQTSPAMSIPMSVVYAAPTFGFLLASIRQIQVIVERIKDLSASKKEGSL